jgi:LPS export ABC transporter protein LptC
MYKKITIILIVSFIVGIFYWAVFVPKDDVAEKISKTLEEQKQRADLFLRGVTFSETAEGQKYWEIKAISSKMNNDTGMADLIDVKGTFYSKGRPSMNFISPKVVWDMKDKKISIQSATGFEKNYKFETPLLCWGLESKLISAEGDVVFVGQNLTIRAKGMLADTLDDEISLFGKPTASVVFSDGTMSITSDMFNIKTKADHFSAIGSAYSKKGALEIFAGKISYYSLRSLAAAQDGVILYNLDIKASSDSALFDVKREKVSMKGRALASKGESRLSGENLVIDVKNNKILVKGRSKVFVGEETISTEAR